MEQALEKLALSIKSQKLILFVGAGVSATLNIPTHEKLIEIIAEKLGYDPEIFGTYADSQTLAEYYSLMTGGLGELVSHLDQNWHNSSKINIAESEIHKLIVEIGFPLIYTTNWDNWIEKAFDNLGLQYSKISSVKDIATEVKGVPIIVKFHGDFSDDQSLVFTETQYLDRLQMDSPLDVRLKSDMIGKTVLFIGYSLRDPNIRYLLHWANRAWGRENQMIARPESFIFFDRPNPVQERVLENWGVTSIVSSFDDSDEGLLDFLSMLRDVID